MNDIKPPRNFNLLYHCNVHAQYEYHCRQCNKAKGYYWHTQRKEMLLCDICGHKYFQFLDRQHLDSTFHKLGLRLQKLESINN